jgi:hypothetical protein
MLMLSSTKSTYARLFTVPLLTFTTGSLRLMVGVGCQASSAVCRVMPMHSFSVSKITFRLALSIHGS